MTKSEFLKQIDGLNDKYLKLLDITNKLVANNSDSPRIIDTMQTLNGDITRGISALSYLKSDVENYNKQEIDTRKLFNVDPIHEVYGLNFEEEKETK